MAFYCSSLFLFVNADFVVDAVVPLFSKNESITFIYITYHTLDNMLTFDSIVLKGAKCRSCEGTKLDIENWIFLFHSNINMTCTVYKLRSNKLLLSRVYISRSHVLSCFVSV
jgi:hypothetical protein